MCCKSQIYYNIDITLSTELCYTKHTCRIGKYTTKSKIIYLTYNNNVPFCICYLYSSSILYSFVLAIYTLPVFYTPLYCLLKLFQYFILLCIGYLYSSCILYSFVLAIYTLPAFYTPLYWLFILFLYFILLCIGYLYSSCILYSFVLAISTLPVFYTPLYWLFSIYATLIINIEQSALQYNVSNSWKTFRLFDFSFNTKQNP